MNEKDKKLFLDEIKPKNENYLAYVWGTIMADAKALVTASGISLLIGSVGAALGALSNEYCYIGMTENYLAFVVVGSINVKQVKYRFVIKLSDVKSVKVKRNKLLGRTVISFNHGEGKIKLSLVNNTIGSDMVGQREGVEFISNVIENLL